MQQPSERVSQALRRWKSDLIDLTTDNPLLYFRPDRNALRIVMPSADDLLRQMFSADALRQFRLGRSAAPHETGVMVGKDDRQPVGPVLRLLRQRADLAQSEQGVHTLFLTLGSLRWASREGEAIDSPILVLPVRLNRATVFSDYTVSIADNTPDLSFNPALAIKLRQDYGVDLSALAVNAGASTLDYVIEHVRESIAEHLHWTVAEDVYLALLPFEKYAIYEDLERHTDELLRHPVLRAIAGEPAASSTTTPTLPDVDEHWDTIHKSLSTHVLDADVSQRAALAAVSGGGSVVIQGPPGTGKSQTITNLIAGALGRRKSVLFVSEKKSALNVVAHRLAQLGLGEFCLELHDDELDEAAVFNLLAARTGMGLPQAYRAAPDGTGARAFNEDELVGLLREFDEYFEGLCVEPTALGGTTYDVLGELVGLASAPLIRFDYDPADSGAVTRARLEKFRGTVDDLVSVADILTRPGSSPWQHINPLLVRADPTTRYRLVERLNEVATTANQLSELEQQVAGRWGLSSGGTVERALWMGRLLTDCTDVTGGVFLPVWLDATRRNRAQALASQQLLERSEHLRIREDILSRYGEDVLRAELMSALEDELSATSPGIPQPDPALVEGSVTEPVLQVHARFAAALALAALERVRDLGGTVVNRFGLREPESLSGLIRVNDLVRQVEQWGPLPRSWFDADVNARLQALASTARARATVLGGRAAFLTRFRPELFEIATDEAVQRLQEPDDSLWDRLVALLRWDVGRIEDLQTTERALSQDEALAALHVAREIREASDWFADHEQELDREFGELYTGWETNWNELEHAIGLVARGASLVDPDDPPVSLTGITLQGLARDTLVRDFNNALSLLEPALGMVRDVAPDELVQFIGSIGEQPMQELIVQLRGRYLLGFEALIDAARRISQTRLTPWTTVDHVIKDIHQGLRVNAGDKELRALFGPLVAARTVDWKTISASLNRVERICAQFPDGTVPTGFADRLDEPVTTAADDSQELRDAVERLNAARRRLRPFFLESPLHDDTAFEAMQLSALSTWARDLTGQLSALERWLFSLEARERAASQGLGPFVNAVLQARLPAGKWTDAFAHQMLTLWMTWRLREAPELAQFVRAQPDTMQRRFAELDRAMLAANASDLVNRLMQRRHERLDDANLQSEIALLRTTASSTSKRPLRHLFDRAANLVSALAPCLLMSPMTIARMLGHSPLRFDIVVFDEASQVVPEDAIGAIGRGTQLVVVGDSRQLPPTSFFTTTPASDQWRPESLLEACTVAGLPNTWLQWHYRSRHEDLIAFSNREFYDDRLMTFPSPDHDEDPVEFVRVENGVYERGGRRINRIEASRLVDLVIEQIARDGEASIGVITFSEPQMIAVQEELDRRRPTETPLNQYLAGERHEPLFVRNLENVQGDERDVIFMSVGYGPDTNGNLLLNFGPINRAGGDRRLNVAITRARRKMVILASFDPNELSASSARGVQVLQRYLNFARYDPSEPRESALPDLGQSRDFVDVVARDLARAGLHVERNIGYGRCRIDIGIKDEATSSGYLLGIECDGSAWQIAPDARDRERLRPRVLKGLGWNLHRIWSMAWQIDPDRERERVLDLVERARRQAHASDPEPSEPSAAPPPSSRSGEGRPPVVLSDTSDGGGISLDWEAGPGDDAGETAPEGQPQAAPSAGGTAPGDPRSRDGDNANGPSAPPTAPGRDVRAGSGGAPPVKSAPTSTRVPAPASGEPDAPPPTRPTASPTRQRPRKPEAARSPAASAGAQREETPEPRARLSRSVADIKGLTSAARRMLEQAGITTIGALLAETSDERARRRLARALGVEEAVLTDWVNRADLMRIKGIGVQFANLLESAGVASCRELRQRNPDNLLATLTSANDQHALVSRLPTLARQWISQAEALIDAADEGAPA